MENDICRMTKGPILERFATRETVKPRSWRFLLGLALLGLCSEGCAEMKGYRDKNNRFHYNDERAAAKAERDFFNDTFTDRYHPPVSIPGLD